MEVSPWSEFHERGTVRSLIELLIEARCYTVTVVRGRSWAVAHTSCRRRHTAITGVINYAGGRGPKEQNPKLTSWRKARAA